MRVVAVIVTFNRLKALQKTLQATLQQAFSAVVVVDNASVDGTKEWLAQQKDRRLHVVSLPENKGGAGGFHAGMSAALATLQPDWLVLFDDDAYPATDALSAFLAQDLSGCDGAAAAVYYPDGSICEMNRPSYNPFWHLSLLGKTITGLVTGKARAGFHIPDSAYTQKARLAVDCSSFVGFFIRAEYARQYALPLASLFIYGDDLLYTLQLSARKKHLYFFPTVRFIHDCSTFQTKNKAYHPMWKAYFTYRNGLIIYRLAAGRWFYPAALLKITAWFVTFRFYSDKKRFLRLWYWAVKDGLRQDTSRKPQSVMQRERLGE